MKALRTEELVRIRAETHREGADRWRRQFRASHDVEACRKVASRPASGEPSRWLTWLFVEPDPGYYGRRG